MYEISRFEVSNHYLTRHFWDRRLFYPGGYFSLIRRKQVNQCSNATLGSLKARRRLLRSRAHSCQSLQVEIIMNSFVKNTPTSFLSAIPFFKVTGHKQTRLKMRYPVMSVILGTCKPSYNSSVLLWVITCV